MLEDWVLNVANSLENGAFSLAEFHHLDDANGVMCCVNLQEEL
jgi:hypothetical protein